MPTRTPTRWWPCAFFFSYIPIILFHFRLHETPTTLHRKIWKRSFYFSTVRPTVYTSLSRKTSFSNLSNFKTPALRFSVDRKHLKTKLFENDDSTIIMSSPSFPQTQIQNDEVIVSFSNFSGVVWTGPKLSVLEMEKTIGVAHFVSVFKT